MDRRIKSQTLEHLQARLRAMELVDQGAKLNLDGRSDRKLDLEIELALLELEAIEHQATTQIHYRAMSNLIH